jgi:predicted nucleic acid-binding protein
MSTPLILLDAGVLWFVLHPSGGNVSKKCRIWMKELAAKGYEFGVAEVTDYEVRRKLLHQRKLEQLRRLDRLLQRLLYLEITTTIMRRAAELWAEVRWRGMSTADPKALDADVILGAQWEEACFGGRRVVIATTNVGHLRLVSQAEEWSAIS